jgi:hypothetical protein
MNLKNILVATDFGEAADMVLAHGRELAGRFAAPLHVVHVAQNLSINVLRAESLSSDVGGLDGEPFGLLVQVGHCGVQWVGQDRGDGRTDRRFRSAAAGRPDECAELS